jgi:hypothetical protein
MKNKNNEINILIDHVVTAMINLNIININDSKMSSSSRLSANNIWFKVSETYNNKKFENKEQQYKEVMRLRSLWINSSNNFKGKVEQKLNQV